MPATPAPINLLDVVLSTGEEKPAEVVFGDVTIPIRRSHTGAQYAAWARIEEDYVTAVTDAATGDGKVAEKNTRIAGLRSDYLLNLVTTLSADEADETDLIAAAEVLTDLPSDVLAAVTRKLGTIAGVVDAEGNMIPFAERSDEKKTSDT